MRSKTKKISLTVFKAWLQGVEELQPKGWYPDKQQWMLIRKKINNIESEHVSPREHVTTYQHISQNNIETVPKINAPEIPSEFDNVEITEPTSEVKSLLADGQKPGTHVTPNVDTSDGNYKSSFS